MHDSLLVGHSAHAVVMHHAGPATPSALLSTVSSLPADSVSEALARTQKYTRPPAPAPAVPGSSGAPQSCQVAGLPLLSGAKDHCSVVAGPVADTSDTTTSATSNPLSASAYSR